MAKQDGCRWRGSMCLEAAKSPLCPEGQHEKSSVQPTQLQRHPQSQSKRLSALIYGDAAANAKALQRLSLPSPSASAGSRSGGSFSQTPRSSLQTPMSSTDSRGTVRPGIRSSQIYHRQSTRQVLRHSVAIEDVGDVNDGAASTSSRLQASASASAGATKKRLTISQKVALDLAAMQQSAQEVSNQSWRPRHGIKEETGREEREDLEDDSDSDSSSKGQTDCKSTASELTSNLLSAGGCNNKKTLLQMPFSDKTLAECGPPSDDGFTGGKTLLESRRSLNGSFAEKTTCIDRVKARTSHTLRRSSTFGAPALHRAIATGNATLAVSLIHETVKTIDDANRRDEYGRSALHQAIHDGLADVAKLLIQKGADLNSVDKDGHPPLYRAVVDGCKLEFLKLLLEAKAEPEAKALHRAIKIGNEEAAELLACHCAKLDVKDENGTPPLHLAIREGLSSVARILISRGAKVNAVDECGRSPLDWACRVELIDGELCQELVDSGAEIDAII
eukprot:TRINITY_DN37884_c0_g1_i1.p1 TRINITY_DN37884_c0_g1~~TRINITY_DN37884_c0_g1_i1.p1  ORF type:complete len:504 (-),score=107.67 TRINITY_DN37884_c0_g1_i1:68-1579(-)